MLASGDARLAANKRLVYDFWREVFEGAHMEFADKYMAESYIQHNPNVPTGRAAFVDFFSRDSQARADRAAHQGAAGGDRRRGRLRRARASRAKYVDPKDATKKYSTTWFDMFRLENGKIAEHWDPALKP